MTDTSMIDETVIDTPVELTGYERNYARQVLLYCLNTGRATGVSNVPRPVFLWLCDHGMMPGEFDGVATFSVFDEEKARAALAALSKPEAEGIRE